jgi:hypothetical protein
MFGVCIDGCTNSFCDGESVDKNATRSTLTKKHNLIVYHKFRECAAYKAICLVHESGKVNLSDAFTKFYQ